MAFLSFLPPPPFSVRFTVVGEGGGGGAGRGEAYVNDDVMNRYIKRLGG